MFERMHAVHTISINTYLRMYNMTHYVLLPVPIIFSGVQQALVIRAFMGRSWGECFSDRGLFASTPMAGPTPNPEIQAQNYWRVAGTPVYDKNILGGQSAPSVIYCNVNVHHLGVLLKFRFCGSGIGPWDSKLLSTLTVFCGWSTGPHFP